MGELGGLVMGSSGGGGRGSWLLPAVHDSNFWIC